MLSKNEVLELPDMVIQKVKEGDVDSAVLALGAAVAENREFFSQVITGVVEDVATQTILLSALMDVLVEGGSLDPLELQEQAQVVSQRMQEHLDSEANDDDN
jgi:hypothetical protein